MGNESFFSAPQLKRHPLGRLPELERAITTLGRARLAGAVAVLGTVLWKYGLPPPSAALDSFIWILAASIALFGAILGAGVVLAWRHLRESLVWIFWTAACLVALSALIVVPFANEMRANSAFLATADSTRGLIAGKMYRGGPRLNVTYEVGGQQHRLLTPAFDQRYDQWARGDSVWVYFQASAPDSSRLGRFGPDPVPAARSLAWLWGVGGVLLLGYLPPIVLFVRKQLRRLPASPIPSPPPA